MTKLIDFECSDFKEATTQQVWRDAMMEECQSIVKNNSWEIVPRLEGKSWVTSKWIYKLNHATNLHANHLGDPPFVFGAQNGSHGSLGDRIDWFYSNIEGLEDGAIPPMSQGVTSQTGYFAKFAEIYSPKNFTIKSTFY